MNPFISIYELSELSDYQLLCCKEEGECLMVSIAKSLQFTLPNSNIDLISKVQRLSIEESKKIICYDRGNLLSAGKVFWAMRAAGFEKIFILLGGVHMYSDLGFETSTENMEEIQLADQKYLPFNNSILQIYDEKSKKSVFYQRIRIDEDIPVTTPRGVLLPKETMIALLKTHNIKYKSGKPIQVYGKYCSIIAAVLIFLGVISVSVLFDTKDPLFANKIVRDPQGFNEKESVASIQAYSNYDDSTSSYYTKLPVHPLKSDSRKAGNICGNCSIY